ncbi:CvpA family protein [Bombilactobacillus thymidiniphilus]|uniref:CvpA family protein n=1 Tax=Bombilactobacillus thymidiniphilus TaxID=2923363 RepID=A0ABY4PEA2_9LACO|nr:CvpA family protein [Bombilactobacillus thymidiniphilus]UQS83895.1 CvpA family protein [Bombilactobacillus thymidiniphilus]
MLIMLILAYGVYAGIRRGLALQIVYTCGYLISFLVAIFSYRSIGPKLDLIIPYPSASPQSYFAFFSPKVSLSLDKSFYLGTAFLMVVFGGWIITRIVGAYFTDWTYLTIGDDWNAPLSGILALICNYIGIFIVLYIMALVPISGLQHLLNHSWLASVMIRYSTGLTDLFTKLLIYN